MPPGRDRAAARPRDVHAHGARERVRRGKQRGQARDEDCSSHARLPSTTATLPCAARYSPAAGLCATTWPTCARAALRVVTVPSVQTARVRRCFAAASVIPITRGTEQTFGALEHLVLNHISAVSGCICVLLAWDEARRKFIEKLKALGVPLLVLIIVGQGQRPPLDPGPMRDEPDRFRILELGQIKEGLARLAFR